MAFLLRREHSMQRSDCILYGTDESVQTKPLRTTLFKASLMSRLATSIQELSSESKIRQFPMAAKPFSGCKRFLGITAVHISYQDVSLTAGMDRPIPAKLILQLFMFNF